MMRMALGSVYAARPYCFVKHRFIAPPIALATAAATGSVPALMAALFGETRVSARVAKIRKSHVARPG
jgi:hypothetical protein